MDKPQVYQKASMPVDGEKGNNYFWCSCGKSEKQPFCDGSHTGSSFTPIIYQADKTQTVYFCGCKHSNKAPLCDGSHGSLP